MPVRLTDAGAAAVGAADAGAAVEPELEQAETTMAPTSTMPERRATPLSLMSSLSSTALRRWIARSVHGRGAFPDASPAETITGT